MSHTSQSAAARRLGKISAVPPVQAPVRNLVVVPRSTVVTHHAVENRPTRPAIGPTRAFARGIGLLCKDVLRVPLDINPTSLWQYAALAVVFGMLPLCASAWFVQSAPIAPNMHLTAFVSATVFSYLIVCVCALIVRSLRLPVEKKVNQVVERGRRG